MRKKIVRLTESQLYDLVEQTLNELDIRTRANAANQAMRDADRYKAMAKDMSNNSLKRQYGQQMLCKREKQVQKFANSVNNDLFRRGDNFAPKPSSRGSYYTLQPTVYDNGRKLDLTSSYLPTPDECYMKEYTLGNSYFDKELGQWLDPNDGVYYDWTQSEPWSQIRKQNESLARRVTENVIRKLSRM